MRGDLEFDVVRQRGKRVYRLCKELLGLRVIERGREGHVSFQISTRQRFHVGKISDIIKLKNQECGYKCDTQWKT